MKKITSVLACLSISILSFAQAPQKFNYQGVARGSSGNVFSNQLLGFKLSILQGSSTGTPVYVETQAVTSDGKGIFSLEVGGGTIVSGVFSSIGWGVNSYWLKTEMDTTGGSNYQFMGSTQMISVPYALYSETTGDTSLWKKNGNDIYRLNGNVGIGTNLSGTTKLQVVTNSANAVGIKVQDVLGARIFLAPLLGGGGFNSLSQAGDAGIFYKSAGLGGSFVLGPWNSIGGIRIDTTGKVGIGVSSAVAKLDIAGNIKITDGTEGTGKVLTSDATGLASWQTPSGGGGNPVGTILSYGGTSAPSGYLLCDGQQVSRTTYSSLFVVLGTAYGSGDGSTTFHLPDLRGRFLRGVDGTAGNDPDKASRTASNTGGNTGNNIGSLQSHELQSHSHTASTLSQPSGSPWGFSASAQTFFTTVSTNPTGGNETRPKNVYVNYIIKY